MNTVEHMSFLHVGASSGYMTSSGTAGASKIWAQEKNPEQNTSGLCCKTKNQQMGPHKVTKLLYSKGQCQ